MKIKRIDIENDEYDALSRSVGNIFSSKEWLRIYGRNLHLYGVFENENELVGGFYLYKQNKYGLTILRTPPFSPTIGPLLLMRGQRNVANNTRTKEILSNIAGVLRKSACTFMSAALNRNVVDTQPFAWMKFKVNPRYTYVIDVKQSEEDIWSNMAGTRRNDIRKAEKDGIAVTLEKDLGVVKSLILKTFERQRKKIDVSIIDRILFEFANASNSYAFVSYKGESPLAAAFCVHDKKTAYYLLGGYDPAKKHHGAGALAVWDAVRHAMALDLEEFDFEGSMVPQIERYFRDFGGHLVPYYSVHRALLPLEMILKFIKREIF